MGRFLSPPVLILLLSMGRVMDVQCDIERYKNKCICGFNTGLSVTLDAHILIQMGFRGDFY